MDYNPGGDRMVRYNSAKQSSHLETMDILTKWRFSLDKLERAIISFLHPSNQLFS